VGLVLRDQIIIDVGAANAALERGGEFPLVPMPDDMLFIRSKLYWCRTFYSCFVPEKRIDKAVAVG
jgi:hypothetical protein